MGIIYLAVILFFFQRRWHHLEGHGLDPGTGGRGQGQRITRGQGQEIRREAGGKFIKDFLTIYLKRCSVKLFSP